MFKRMPERIGAAFVILAMAAGCGTGGTGGTTGNSPVVDILAEGLSEGTTLTQIGNPHDKPAPQKPGTGNEPETEGEAPDSGGGSYAPGPVGPSVPEGPVADGDGEVYPLLPNKPTVEPTPKDRLLICLSATPEWSGKIESEDSTCPYYTLTIDLVDAGSARLLLYSDEAREEWCGRSFSGFSFDENGVMSIEFDRAAVVIEPVESCEEIEIVVEATPEDSEETAPTPHLSMKAPPLPDMIEPQVVAPVLKPISEPIAPKPTKIPLQKLKPLQFVKLKKLGGA